MVATAPATMMSAASYQCPPIARPLALCHITILDKPQQPNNDDPGPSAIAMSPRMTTQIPAPLAMSMVATMCHVIQTVMTVCVVTIYR